MYKSCKNVQTELYQLPVSNFVCPSQSGVTIPLTLELARSKCRAHVEGSEAVVGYDDQNRQLKGRPAWLKCAKRESQETRGPQHTGRLPLNKKGLTFRGHIKYK